MIPAIVVAKSGIWLRAKPSADTPVMGVLPFKSRVDVLAIEYGERVSGGPYRGGWAYVRGAYRTGWCVAEWLLIDEPMPEPFL